MNMAMAAPVEEDPLSEDLNCPICLDILDEPVTLYNCFHSFCKKCLMNAIQGSREAFRHPYTCPQCRRRFFPSDAEKVNHHLQNIVNSHRKAKERIADIRTYELQEMTSQSHEVAVAAEREAERPSKKELDSLTSFLTAVDGRLQCLLTALDRTSIQAGGYPQVSAERGTTTAREPDESCSQSSEPVTVCAQTSLSGETRDQTHQSRGEIVFTPPVAQERHLDCEFEAETLQEFMEHSLIVCRRHFLLIAFVVHACLLVFCFFMAFL